MVKKVMQVKNLQKNKWLCVVINNEKERLYLSTDGKESNASQEPPKE